MIDECLFCLLCCFLLLICVIDSGANISSLSSGIGYVHVCIYL